MGKVRYKQCRGCTNCRVPLFGLGPGDCCPYCGGVFCGGPVSNQYTYKEIWKPCKVKWWNPSTWSGGSWSLDPNIAKKLKALNSTNEIENLERVNHA